MAKDNGIVMRVPKELAERIKDISEKNKTSMKQAGKDIAMALKTEVQGKRINREIRF